ncbi:Cupin-2 domain-containing protein [Fusarium sp. LHS14.1]|nr:Cupin-2 domain-containing protein [Fusarium sp. LHS14.1]
MAQSVGRSIVIVNSQASPNSTSRGGSTFTGTAWVEDVYRSTDGTITTVMFEPGARSFWHRHQGGQTLRVLAGAGWVRDQGGEAQRINVGDTVWCQANTTHWHGADEGSYLVHLAISHGQTEWLGEVTAEEYGKAHSRG